MKNIFLLIFLICISTTSRAQIEYEGYILCIDNTGDAAQEINEYFYLPKEYLNNNYNVDKETLMVESDSLEFVIKKHGGIRFYKYIQTFSDERCFDKAVRSTAILSKINMKFAYFHYKKNDLLKLEKEFFLKKINGNKFYISKVKFQGCILIDKNYLNSKVKKMYIYDIQGDILPLNSKEEKKKIINFIKRSYCNKGNGKD